MVLMGFTWLVNFDRSTRNGQVNMLRVINKMVKGIVMA